MAVAPKELKDRMSFKGVTVKFSQGVQLECSKLHVGFYNRPSSSKPENMNLLCAMSKNDVSKTISSGENPNWVIEKKSQLENIDDVGKLKENKGLVLGNVIKILMAMDANKKLQCGLALLEIKPNKEYIICLKEEAEENKDNPEKIPLSSSADKIWSVEDMVEEEMKNIQPE